MRVQVRRVYESRTRTRGDGVRVLVDRLWPRGISKESLELDRWAKEITPSSKLRVWYGHRPERFEEFAERYRAELREPEATTALDELRREAGRRTITLLTATKDVEHSAAAILADVFLAGPGGIDPRPSSSRRT
jgi:uncharacterized protein YeaO (DUF488 family)